MGDRRGQGKQEEDQEQRTWQRQLGNSSNTKHGLDGPHKGDISANTPNVRDADAGPM